MHHSHRTNICLALMGSRKFGLLLPLILSSLGINVLYNLLLGIPLSTDL
jgi:hypothetical protein